jgi:hypothetical protein
VFVFDGHRRLQIEMDGSVTDWDHALVVLIGTGVDCMCQGILGTCHLSWYSWKLSSSTVYINGPILLSFFFFYLNTMARTRFCQCKYKCSKTENGGKYIPSTTFDRHRKRDLESKWIPGYMGMIDTQEPHNLVLDLGPGRLRNCHSCRSRRSRRRRSRASEAFDGDASYRDEEMSGT